MQHQQAILRQIRPVQQAASERCKEETEDYDEYMKKRLARVNKETFGFGTAKRQVGGVMGWFSENNSMRASRSDDSVSGDEGVFDGSGLVEDVPEEDMESATGSLPGESSADHHHDNSCHGNHYDNAPPVSLPCASSADHHHDDSNDHCHSNHYDNVPPVVGGGSESSGCTALLGSIPVPNHGGDMIVPVPNDKGYVFATILGPEGCDEGVVRTGAEESGEGVLRTGSEGSVIGTGGAESGEGVVRTGSEESVVGTGGAEGSGEGVVRTGSEGSVVRTGGAEGSGEGVVRTESEGSVVGTGGAEGSGEGVVRTGAEGNAIGMADGSGEGVVRTRSEGSVIGMADGSGEGVVRTGSEESVVGTGGAEGSGEGVVRTGSEGSVVGTGGAEGSGEGVVRTGAEGNAIGMADGSGEGVVRTRSEGSVIGMADGSGEGVVRTGSEGSVVGMAEGSGEGVARTGAEGIVIGMADGNCEGVVRTVKKNDECDVVEEVKEEETIAGAEVKFVPVLGEEEVGVRGAVVKEEMEMEEGGKVDESEDGVRVVLMEETMYEGEERRMEEPGVGGREGEVEMKEEWVGIEGEGAMVMGEKGGERRIEEAGVSRGDIEGEVVIKEEGGERRMVEAVKADKEMECGRKAPVREEMMELDESVEEAAACNGGESRGGEAAVVDMQEGGGERSLEVSVREKEIGLERSVGTGEERGEGVTVREEIVRKGEEYIVVGEDMEREGVMIGAGAVTGQEREVMEPARSVEEAAGVDRDEEGGEMRNGVGGGERWRGGGEREGVGGREGREGIGGRVGEIEGVDGEEREVGRGEGGGEREVVGGVGMGGGVGEGMRGGERGEGRAGEMIVDVEENSQDGLNVQNMLSSLVYSLGLNEMETKQIISLWHNRTVVPPLDPAHLSQELARREQLFREEHDNFELLTSRAQVRAEEQVREKYRLVNLQ